jgi:hypothetical protein
VPHDELARARCIQHLQPVPASNCQFQHDIVGGDTPHNGLGPPATYSTS